MQPEETILVVDDEEAIRRVLRIALTGQGYRIVEAATAAQALATARQRKPDAVLLDMGLPDLSGLEVTRRLRESSWVPIVFVSVQDDERIKVQALDAGADDYLCKPFNMDELMARLRAALRRKHVIPSGRVLHCGELSLDLDGHTVTLRSKRVSVSPTEFALLEVLMRNQGKLVSHRQLLTQVWGEAYAEESHMLRVNISNLRKKIEAAYLVNEPGLGYRLVSPEADSPSTPS